MEFVSVAERFEVDTDLNIESKECQDVIFSKADNFDRWYAIYRPDHDVELDGYFFTALENCHLGETVILRDQGVKIFEVILDTPAGRGQTQIVRHHELSDWARLRRAASGPRIPNPIPNFILEVRFSEGAIPQSCEEIYQRRPVAVLQRKRPLILSPGRRAHIVINGGPPDEYGIQWE